MGVARHEGRDTFRDLHAETSVLGAILMNNDMVAIAADALTEDDFAREAHGVIYGVMVALWKHNRPIDLITIIDGLGSRLDAIGGPSYIASLIDSIPRPRNIDAYVTIVREKSLRRQMRTAVTMAKAAVDDADLSLLEASEVLTGIVQKHAPKPQMAHADAYMDRFSAWVDDDEGREAGKVFTGISSLDAIHRGGLPVGAMAFGGRTSHGKTAAATSIAINIGIGSMAEPVMFVSGEMDERQMTGRIIASHGRFDGEAIIAGDLQYVDRRALKRTIEEVRETSKITIVDRKLTPSQLRAAAIRMKAERDLKLLVIDYIQIMRPDPKMLKNGVQRHQVLGEMMRAYKDIADELQIPAMVLAQLSRSATQKKRPTLEDLRESGDIEQDAHVVWLLNRPPGETDGEIIVAKNRNGRVGVASVFFDQGPMRYTSADGAITEAARQYAHASADDEGY